MQAFFTKNVCENERIGSHCGGMDPLGGCGPPMWHFSPKMHVKMKELGPVGGACAEHVPPRSANATTFFQSTVFSGNHLGTETLDMSGWKPIWTTCAKLRIFKFIRLDESEMWYVCNSRLPIRPEI